ncbi:SDR family NAD(P)-dependent oxidoreductase [Ideonella sp. DXS22W]|uniref:SDR family NAD(P)-dependent oxidoreductase n=1 Tax=Pseudaquabacterium inlustre TaxID=2984192 RepID=A0ABU9CG60_9BURK
MAVSSPWTLRDGVAVLTGAASGIGAALAVELARQGMHLALVDRDAAGLAAAAERAAPAGTRITQHVIDLAASDARSAIAALPQAVQALHGRATVLVNNAGVAVGGSFDQVSEDDFDWLMRVNFEAPVRLCRAFLPLLARQPAAQVVNVSSIFGIVAPPGQTAYCASKFAVRGFSESLRHELQAAASPVGVTVVHPGGVRTAIAENARLPAGVDATLLAEQQATWRKLLTLSPEAAAARIAQGIARREPRVLVGQDAVRAAWLQRFFPVGYWKHAARDILRRTGRA